MSTNLQKIPVKISWHSDVWSTSYSDLSDANLDILKKMDSKQFRVLIYHCFLMKKTQCKLRNGLKSATVTLLHQKQPFVGGMLSLNVVVQTLKMLNALAGKWGSYTGNHRKKSLYHTSLYHFRSNQRRNHCSISQLLYLKCMRCLSSAQYSWILSIPQNSLEFCRNPFNIFVLPWTLLDTFNYLEFQDFEIL